MHTVKRYVARTGLRSSVHVLVAALLLIHQIASIKWLGMQHEHNRHWNSSKMCRKLKEFGLSEQQTNMCRRNVESMLYVQKAANLTVSSCQHLFRDHMWNCPTVKLLPDLLPDLATGTRERALVYSLSSAALTYMVARGCTTSAKSCGCSAHPSSPPDGEFKWGGCGDNINFGSRFSRDFVNGKKKVRNQSQTTEDMHQIVDKFNARVGIRIVSDSLVTHCKCHGVSGSCSIKTCWQGLPTKFSAIEERLMTGYTNAIKLPGLLRSRNLKKYKHLPSLLHTDTLNYCDNPKTYIFGTSGRECNDSLSAVENCDTLCCKRGHRLRTVQITEKCNCKYRWCCEVHCDQCIVQKNINICN